MTNKITASDIETLERELNRAREQFAQQVREDRPAFVAQLAAIKKSLNEQIREAERIASAAGLVFYYSTGYEDFYWTEEENWSESSRNC